MTIDTSVLSNLLLPLITDPKMLSILSPLIVALVKQLTTKLPSWSLPLLSVVVGALGAGLTGVPVATGAVLGGAGVGVREIVDQISKAYSKSKSDAAPTVPTKT